MRHKQPNSLCQFAEIKPNLVMSNNSTFLVISYHILSQELSRKNFRVRETIEYIGLSLCRSLQTSNALQIIHLKGNWIFKDWCNLLVGPGWGKNWELYSNSDYETPINSFWDMLGKRRWWQINYQVILQLQKKIL